MVDTGSMISMNGILVHTPLPLDPEYDPRLTLATLRMFVVTPFTPFGLSCYWHVSPLTWKVKFLACEHKSRSHWRM